jgi:hypothetical protein
MIPQVMTGEELERDLNFELESRPPALFLVNEISIKLIIFVII